ncbi:MAG: hypothetical protein ACLGPL_08100 [Acidobacteriota bacterium]
MLWPVLPPDIRRNTQFQHRQPGKINFIVFNLKGILRRVKVILLAHDFPVRATVVGGPPHKELLGALVLFFLKHQVNALDPQRLAKQEPDSLRTRF